MGGTDQAWTHLIHCTLADVHQSKDHCMQTEKHITGIHWIDTIWIRFQEFLLFIYSYS